MQSSDRGSGRLQDKVAIITGASSGIGRAIAIEYGRQGAKVVCADLVPNARHGDEAATTTLEVLQKEIGSDRVLAVTADMSKGDEVQALVQKTAEQFGRVDIIVNNVGIGAADMPLHETPDESWDKTMAVNARSVFLGSKHAIAQMLKQEPHQSGDRGWIINIASILALVGAQGCGSYSASKGAIVSLTKQMAIEYASQRIHCNSICPGFTETALLLERPKWAGRREIVEKLHPFRGLGVAEDIVGPAVFFASSDARWVTGTALAVDGGFTAR